MPTTDRPLNILCVEDDQLDRDLVSSYAKGSAIQFARDLETARIAMDTGVFDVILLDLGLATSAGLDTCLQARALWPDTPIVVHSASDDESLMQACIDAGADDYLVKHDESPTSLMRAIRFAIDRRRRAAAEMRSKLESEHRRALERQLAMQTALIRTIGHELNTPLTPIRLRLGLLARHDDADVRRAADTIKRNMDRLQRSLSNALEAWQLSEDRGAGRPTSVSVRQAVEEVLQDCGPLIDTSGIRLEVDVEDVHVEADPDRFFHLLSNLITNGAVYGQEWLRIEARNEDGVVIDIANGGRMPPSIKQHLFEPFVNQYRDDGATAPGAGLGIHVAKTLSQNQDIGLALVSDDPVVFRLRAKGIPAAPSEPLSATA